MPVSERKNCHNSVLKITNCKEKVKSRGGGLLKTRWKLWNSTGKTGFGTGLFNFLHRVFNMWKKSKPFTQCIAPVCGKLSASAKRRKNRLRTGAAEHGGQDISAKAPERKRQGAGCEKIWRGKTNPFILLVLQGGLCYTLLWITINEDHRGAAAVWELQPCPWGWVPHSRAQPRIERKE